MQTTQEVYLITGHDQNTQGFDMLNADTPMAGMVMHGIN